MRSTTMSGKASILVLAASCLAHGAALAQSDGSTWAGTPGARPPGSVLVLPPPVQWQRSSLANGCWVRFFDQKGYGGTSLTVVGPIDLPRMELGDGRPDWDSAIVGPRATVRTYGDDNFHERTAVLRPGQSVPDLAQGRREWFGTIASAQVSCS